MFLQLIIATLNYLLNYMRRREHPIGSLKAHNFVPHKTVSLHATLATIFLSYYLCRYGHSSTIIEHALSCPKGRLRPIMPKILPIMLLSIAQNLDLLCSKLCFQNQDNALELTVLSEYISLS